MAAPSKFVFFVLLGAATAILGLFYLFSLDKDSRTDMFGLQFIVVTDILIIVACRYAWKHLVTRVVHTIQIDERPILWTTWKVLLIFFFGCTLFSLMAKPLLTSTNPHWLSMVSYACLGIFMQLVTCIFAMGLVGRTLNIFGCSVLTRYVMHPPARASISTICALGLAASGMYTALQIPDIQRVQVPIHKLPKSMNGFRIIQLSDIHLGPTVGRDRFQTVVNMVNNLKGDLVAVTGDLVDSSISKLRHAVEPIKHIKSKHGNFFITGNHEYLAGYVDDWFRHLKTLNVTSLHNSHVKIRSSENKHDFFYLAGTDDLESKKLLYEGHGMDLNQALQSCDTKHPIILMAHQPEAAKIALESKFDISLVLSGHTHGGQIFPWSVGVYLFNPYYAGLYKHSNSSYVYVSSGTFYWGIPMKQAKMEITEITLLAS